MYLISCMEPLCVICIYYYGILFNNGSRHNLLEDYEEYAYLYLLTISTFFS